MKIFAFSGLGADERVFKFLELHYELFPINWIEPKRNESIIEYSKRLIEKYDINSEKKFGLIGVSFGGLIAVEISKILNPTFTILISSIETKYDLRFIYRLFGKSGLINLIPYKIFLPPKFLASYFFGTKNTKLLYSILNDTDPKFAKWAVKELINWKNKEKINNLINITGSKDKLLFSNASNQVIIKNGKHFMIVDRAKEINNIINSKIKKFV